VATRAKKKSKASRRDPLKEYKRKRDFKRTGEPAAKVAKGEGSQFVVQKHDARRVHYDLRLELDGTLKSWAVARGPSMIVGEKRLAVRTEDHPMQYLDFEGNIPQGEYGGGAMIVWDRGRWVANEDPARGLTKGHLDITLDGTRLKGRWHLVRMKPRPGEKKEMWLLIKASDEYARDAGMPDITGEETTSFLSGLTTQELAASGALRSDHAGRETVKTSRKIAPPDLRKVAGARKGILPAFLEPSLPQIVDKAPSGSQWVHEIKYDGYRTQARIDGRNVQLLTRTGLDWTKRFPSVSAALKTTGLASALIDGEIVVEDASGIPQFGLLQADLSTGRKDRFRYFVFDLLYCEGFDLTKATLLDRKTVLQQLSRAWPPTLRFSEHLEQDGPTMFEHASRLGLEGIVSKRKDQPYRAGRGNHWLKTKSVLRQEFIILGYIPSTATKSAVGALALGYNGGGKLMYAGRVGSGFSMNVAQALRNALEQISAPKPKLGNALPAGADKGVRWAKPQLVCEVEYRGWTEDQLIRQASFKGLREDRAADEIVLETAPEPEPTMPKRTRAADLAAKRLTHPERILWPDPGVTKQGLADFYTDIADHILPHVAGRVLSLVRCPSGVAAKCFYAKHAWDGLSKAAHRIDVGEDEPMLWIADLAGLIDLVQASVLEIHPWGSMAKQLEKPDRLIFDLDPGEDVPWSAVVDAAHDVRARLDDLGLQSFVKTSGGKGLHVVLPIEPTLDWDQAKAFCASVAESMAKSDSRRYIATMSKSARKGRIFIDYLRNARGATAVAPFSTRALPKASVSTPLAWEELAEGIRADHFTIDNLRHRLDALRRDPWEGFFSVKQRIKPEGKARKT
jgi:bifunctional non-homologous end joining protein LigD